MELHEAAVAFFDADGHGVETGVLSLLSGKETAPRLIGRTVEGVGFGTDLEEDGVDAGTLEEIELPAKVGTEAGLVHALVVAVERMEPYAAELALGRKLGQHRQAGEAQGKKHRPCPAGGKLGAAGR